MLQGVCRRGRGEGGEGAEAGGGEGGGAGPGRRRPSPGAAALMLLLPAAVLHLLSAARSGPARLLGLPPQLPAPEALWSPRALGLWLAWLGLQAALYLLPARKVRPVPGARGGGRGSAPRRRHPQRFPDPCVPADGGGPGAEGPESPALPH